MEDNKTEKTSLLKLVDSAIIIFVVSTIFILLSFSFNCGYNSYFGIPLMFTNASWSALIFRIPQLSDIIVVIGVACLIITFGFNLVKQHIKRILTDEKTDILLILLMIIIVLFIFEIVFLWSFLVKKQIISLALSLLLLIIIVTLLIVYLNLRRIIREINNMEKKHQDTSEDEINGYKSNTNIKNKIQDSGNIKLADKTINILNAYPEGKFLKLSFSVSVIALLFLLFFTWGIYSANSQTNFCFIDENRVIIATTDTNVIVIQVKYDTEKGLFENQNRYEILSQENLAFESVECGRIDSDVRIQDKAWSLIFNQPFLKIRIDSNAL